MNIKKKISSLVSRLSSRRAFTMIELLTAVALIALLSIITLGNFWGARNTSDLSNTVGQAATLLRQAQSQAMSGAQNAAWGVRFGNAAGSSSATFYALFSGTYSTATVATYYQLPKTVLYVTSTLAAGSTTDIIFSAITGRTTSTQIGFFIPKGGNLSSTIIIATSGQVSY